MRLGHLRQGLLHERAVFGAAGVQHFVEAEGRVAQQDFGVLEALVVVGQGEMDFLRDLLDALEQMVAFSASPAAY